MDRIAGTVWLEAIPDAVLIVDARGLIVQANHRCLELLGWAPRDLAGRPIEVLVPERYASHSGWREGFQAAPALRPMGEGRELVARHRDGREIAVDLVLSPVIVAGTDYVLLSMRDARAQRSRLEELRLKSIALDEAASGIVVTDASGVIVWVNRAVARMTGYAPAELVGPEPEPAEVGRARRDLLSRALGDDPAGPDLAGRDRQPAQGRHALPRGADHRARARRRRRHHAFHRRQTGRHRTQSAPSTSCARRTPSWRAGWSRSRSCRSSCASRRSATT